MRGVLPAACVLAVLMTAVPAAALVEAVGGLAAMAMDTGDTALAPTGMTTRGLYESAMGWSPCESGPEQVCSATVLVSVALSNVIFLKQGAEAVVSGLVNGPADPGGLVENAGAVARTKAEAAREQVHATEAAAWDAAWTGYDLAAYGATHPEEAVMAHVPDVGAPAPPAVPAPPGSGVVDAIAAGPIGTYQWAYAYIDGRVRDAVEGLDGAPSPLTGFADQVAGDVETKAEAVGALAAYLTSPGNLPASTQDVRDQAASVAELARFLTANHHGTASAGVGLVFSTADGTWGAAENFTESHGNVIATGALSQAQAVIQSVRTGGAVGLVEAVARSQAEHLDASVQQYAGVAALVLEDPGVLCEQAVRYVDQPTPEACTETL